MRVGIDYTAALRQGAGIGRYTRQLVKTLVEVDRQNEYVLLAASGGKSRLSSAQAANAELQALTAHANVRSVGLPISDRALNVVWHRLRLPLPVELATGPLDVFHSPDFTLPPVRGARTILTVHDLSFMRVPECSDPALRSYLMQAVPASVRRADLVLADSESTRADLIELLRTDPDRVEVLHCGVESRFQRVQDARVLQAVRVRYHLPERFMLALGTLQPRKNLERLVEAYALTRGVIGDEVKLVVAGGTGWMHEGILARMEQLGVDHAVCLPGYVEDEDLPALYSLADLFVFPSLYEGFGLPPLEAMACGTPVVTSNVSSLPEVVGDAALTVDPLDVTALAQAMRRVLDDAALRAELVQRGIARAQQFTWSRAARKLLDVYWRVASAQPHA